MSRTTLLGATEQSPTDLRSVTAFRSWGTDVESLAEVELVDDAHAALLRTTNFERFVIGVTRDRADRSPPALHAVIGVGDDGRLTFIGDCTDIYTRFLDDYFRTTAELSDMDPVAAFFEVVASESLQSDLDTRWLGSD